MFREIQSAVDAPWKRRFRSPGRAGAIARSAPTRGLVISQESGKIQQYAWDVPTGTLRPLTDRPGGVFSAVLAPDGRHVYYFGDRHGDEIGHFVRVPYAGGPPQDITPDLPSYTSFALALSPACTILGFSLADRDGDHVCCIDLDPLGHLGPPRLIYHTRRILGDPVFSSDGAVLVVPVTERPDRPQYGLLALDTRRGAVIAELWDGAEASLSCVDVVPDRARDWFFGTTNRTGVERPVLWDPRTGGRVDLDVGDLVGDIVPVPGGVSDGRLVLRHVSHAAYRLYSFDRSTRLVSRLEHPSGVLGLSASIGSTGEIVTQWSDPSHQWCMIALDGRTGRQTRVVLAAEDLPPSRPWTSVTFRSSDNQEIQGWLGVPGGTGPFPTILYLHGGPHEVMSNGFSPESQMWMDHGFAFLTINYRGSTTFGRTFEQQIWGRLGDLELEDLAAARSWLIDSKIARPHQILLTGWSYGGYLTLLALGRQPDLWAGGMAGVAPVDLALSYEDASPPLRQFLVAELGGTPAEQPERYAHSSPSTYAEQVQAPVLIIQGRNDTRCPPRPVEIYEAMMQALGKSIEVRWFSTGHLGFFTDTDESIAHQECLLRFASKTLAKGR